VLEDVDGSLAAVLARQLPEGTTVTFAAPSPGWLDSPPGKQVVSAFLYDIREDPVGRAVDWDDVRDARGRVIGRQPPPRRYEMSYLVTAWAGDADLEHRLLSDVLRLVFLGEVIPEDCRVGSLAETGQPIMLRVVRRDPPHTPAQVWADLGLPPRLVLDLAITAPLIPALVTELAPPAEDMRLGVGRGGPAAFRRQPPPGLRPPLEGGLPEARPDQHWRHRMVDEEAEPEPADGDDPAARSGSGTGNADGPTGNGRPAGNGRPGPGGRRRLTVTKKED
jgi:Pvc16 N-terminal domain